MKREMTKLFLALFVVIGLSACTKETVDNIGRDAALNIATELLAEDETINFNKDGKAYVKKEGNDVRNYSFNMPSAKEMTFDGMTYAIQENIVQSITTLTLVNHTGPIRTEILFKRKR